MDIHSLEMEATKRRQKSPPMEPSPRAGMAPHDRTPCGWASGNPQEQTSRRESLWSPDRCNGVAVHLEVMVARAAMAAETATEVGVMAGAILLGRRCAAPLWRGYSDDGQWYSPSNR